MTVRHDLTPFDQAIDECVLEHAHPLDLVRDLLAGDADARQAAEALALTIHDRMGGTGDAWEWATATALLALAVGAKAERIRQRRRGDHDSERLA